MKKILSLFLLGLVSLALFGCASARTYRVQVNGYTERYAAAPFSPGAKFFVKENPEADNPLLEKEVKAKLERLLRQHGYLLVPYEQAQYVLLFAYGMGAPETVAVAVPDWSVGVGFGTGYWGPGAGYGFYGPGWGWGPYYTETQAIYNRWLRLTVVEGQAYGAAGKAATPVWVGEARSSGTSTDLREVLNALLVAAFEQFGRNTRKAVPIPIKSNDPRFGELETVQ
ncbi:MAG: DUF4136 domain-containing protein [Thermodesulfobacteriota bacterium]